MAPTALSFGIVARTSSKTISATVTNLSPFALPLSDSTSGGDFTINSSTCGSSVAANSKCKIAVKFAPTVVGTESGSLTVTIGSDPTSPHHVTLNGTGL